MRTRDFLILRLFVFLSAIPLSVGISYEPRAFAADEIFPDADLIALHERLNQMSFENLFHHLDRLLEETPVSPKKTVHDLAESQIYFAKVLKSWEKKRRFAVEIKPENLEYSKAVENFQRENSDQVIATQSAPVENPVVAAPESLPVSPLVQDQTNEKSGNELRAEYVEAFRPDYPVYGVHSEMLSQESRDPSQKRGWQLSLGSSDHWPTLNWADSQAIPDGNIPLLGVNTIQGLGVMAGLSQQPSAGIVFAKVPKSWTAHFSGRSEAPQCFGANQMTGGTGQEDSSGFQYCTWLNAEPGAQVLSLTSQTQDLKGGVAAPVMSGVATYLDFTDVRVGAVSGKVVVGGKTKEGQPTSSANITVRIVGQSKAVGLTDTEGRFYFDQVLTISTYPFYMETDRGFGFTHRYHLNPGRDANNHIENLVLYRISSKRVEKWLDQLEGGASKQSGLVVAAVPGVIDQFKESLLIPSVRSIPSSTSLIPETYTVSARGALVPRAPLNLYETQFIGVQVPEGPVIAQVENENKEVVWSQLIVASPGVITIVDEP